jgi:anti-sigma regulatory factor (Ser/Thr protein kinase)
MNLEPLTIPGRAELLSQLMDYVVWAATAAGLGEPGTYRLSLAVDEIATNIVVYGYEDTTGGPDAAGSASPGDLTIWAEADNERLAIHLEDSGRPFDPRQVPLPDNLDRPLEERQDGGLGIFLALWGVDDFSYERRGGVNRSTFVMNLG